MDDCAPVVEEFKQAGIQSDARFAEMKVRSGVAKGQGPARIKAECQQLVLRNRCWNRLCSKMTPIGLRSPGR